MDKGFSNNTRLQLEKQPMRAAFERAAATYEATAVLQREIADRMLARLDLVKAIPSAILDAGCGTGYCMRHLRRRYRRAPIFGIDIAWAMVRESYRHPAPRLAGFLPPIHGWFARKQFFVCGDIEALPLASASVDLIVSNLSLQWCDPDRAFGEFLRVLRPGGLLMFSSFGPDTLKELRAAWRAADSLPHVHTFLDMHDVGDALVRAGFVDPVMDVEHFTLTYSDVTEVMRDVKRLGAHNVARGRARGLTGRARFDRVKRAYESSVPAGPTGLVHGGARIPATYEAVYGHAWAPASSSVTGTMVSVPITSVRRRRA